MSDLVMLHLRVQNSTSERLLGKQAFDDLVEEVDSDLFHQLAFAEVLPKGTFSAFRQVKERAWKACSGAGVSPEGSPGYFIPRDAAPEVEQELRVLAQEFAIAKQAVVDSVFEAEDYILRLLAEAEAQETLIKKVVEWMPRPDYIEHRPRLDWQWF